VTAAVSAVVVPVDGTFLLSNGLRVLERAGRALVVDELPLTV
jgi:hypothetical protein